MNITPLLACTISHLYYINILFSISLFSSTAFSQELPDKIVISDYSWSTYEGAIEYDYEMVLKGEKYELSQIKLRKKFMDKELRKYLTVKLKQIPLDLVKKILLEMKKPKAQLTIADLGYDYQWFEDHVDSALNICRGNQKYWNQEQIDFTKSELTKPENIDDAIRRRILFEGYIPLFHHNTRKFTIELIFTNSTRLLYAGQNYLGLPWVDEKGTAFYNTEISQIMLSILPERKSQNIAAFRKRDMFPGLVRQIYDDKCRKKVKSLTAISYKEELDELKGKYVLSKMMEEGSYSGNWNGEDRIYLQAQSPDMNPGVYMGISLTMENGSLFTRDSILKKADFYVALVQGIPFLMDFLSENDERSIEILFDNGNSLSPKVKKYQKGGREWGCLTGANEDYLNSCVHFVMRDSNGSSNWIITPEQSVILVYYQGNGNVYKYNDRDLSATGPSIRRVCQYFELNGDLKEND